MNFSSHAKNREPKPGISGLKRQNESLEMRLENLEQMVKSLIANN
jgi:hypothetical protein